MCSSSTSEPAAPPSLDWVALLNVPGTFTRPLDTLEVFFKLLADSGAPIQREHWAISLALRLKFPSSITDPGSYVRQAWLLLRYLHPHLGATASGDEAHRITVSPLNTEAWLSETFTDHSKKEGGTTLDSSTLSSLCRPTATATCHWLPATQEVYIRSSHWRIDGVGILMLGYSFMTTLASVLRLGLDLKLDDYPPLVGKGSLTPSPDGLSKVNLTEETTPAILLEATDSLVGSFIQGVPSIALPTTAGSETAVPGATFREVLTLDETTTAAVIALCKERGISVSSAVHAALITVTAKYPQHPLATSYAAFFPTDLRRYLDAPWNSAEFAAGMFCSGLPVCIANLKDKSFADVAAELQAVYSRDLSHTCVDEDGNPVSMVKLVAPYVRRTTKLFNTPPPPELPPVQSPDMSSLGLIEKYIQREYSYGSSKDQKIEVVGFWAGTEMLARSLQCHAWTFRDQLSLQGCYNESFYKKEFVLEVLGKIKDELVAGLAK